MTITPSAVRFTGGASDEALRLSVEHASRQWGGKLEINSQNETFILRSLAFAKLLGVEVTSHQVEPHQQPAFERTLAAIKGNYPKGFFAKVEPEEGPQPQPPRSWLKRLRSGLSRPSA